MTRRRLEREQARARGSISRPLDACQKDLLSLDELRGRMTEVRCRESAIRSRLAALNARQLRADRAGHRILR